MRGASLTLIHSEDYASLHEVDFDMARHQSIATPAVKQHRERYR